MDNFGLLRVVALPMEKRAIIDNRPFGDIIDDFAVFDLSIDLPQIHRIMAYCYVRHWNGKDYAICQDIQEIAVLPVGHPLQQEMRNYVCSQGHNIEGKVYYPLDNLMRAIAKKHFTRGIDFCNTPDSVVCYREW